MNLFLLMAIQTITIGSVLCGGIVVIAYVWQKIRPVIVIKTDKGTFYFGISHSKKRKNMKPLTQEGIDGLKVNENSCFGISNKPSEFYDNIGVISPEKANEILDSIPPKKIDKIEKRNKKK